MKTFSQFISEAVEAIGEASKGDAFDMALARQRVKDKALGAGEYNRHDVKRTAHGLIATRRFDKDDTASDAKKDASGGEPVKRGRGRPPGKYGSYKKRVKESLDIIESLDSEEEIEQFIESLDEESFVELAAFLDESEQLDELNKQTLGSYIKKSVPSSQMAAARFMTAGDTEHSERNKQYKKYEKRTAGINKATDRLTKEDLDELSQDEFDALIEDFEQLDEISKATLGRYILRNQEKSADLAREKADNDDAQSKATSIDYGSNREASKHMKPVRDAIHKAGKEIQHKTSKRRFGMYRAVSRLTKEDFDEENQ